MPSARITRIGQTLRHSSRTRDQCVSHTSECTDYEPPEREAWHLPPDQMWILRQRRCESENDPPSPPERIRCDETDSRTQIPLRLVGSTHSPVSGATRREFRAGCRAMRKVLLDLRDELPHYTECGLTRDPSFIAPIAQLLMSGTLGRDETLSAAIALDVLEASDVSIVTALSSRLGDETLRERFLGFLLAIDTPEALGAVADEMSVRFDAHTCALLGRREGWELRAADLAWRHRTAAERSLSYGLVVPLFGHIKSLETKAYPEKLAFGVGRSVFGHSLRTQAIDGMSVFDPTGAFRAAETAIRDPMCDERDAMPATLMKLNAEVAVPLLLEVARTADDETMELAIADALASVDVHAELLDMLMSETANVRRVAAVIAGRQLDPQLCEQQLRQRALDMDERVSAAAIEALRVQIRTQAVHAILRDAVGATDRRRRWILLDQAAQHARGSREMPPVPSSVLATLNGVITSP